MYTEKNELQTLSVEYQADKTSLFPLNKKTEIQKALKKANSYKRDSQNFKQWKLVSFRKHASALNCVQDSVVELMGQINEGCLYNKWQTIKSKTDSYVYFFNTKISRKHTYSTFGFIMFHCLANVQVSYTDCSFLWLPLVVDGSFPTAIQLCTF